jgi:hypothetical protein
MSVKNRKSVLALVEEVTEGAPVAPTLASDFVALQTGFSIDPNIETIQSDEIRGSIAQTKPMLGQESPNASFSHYLRHSGVEGQAPNFYRLLKSAIGSMTTNGTERQTSAGSTVSAIKPSAGATDFKRGFAVLIKDPVNGFNIRPVLSVAAGDLNLGFNLPTGAAPGSGVKLGKCVNFSPLDEGTPSLSAWLYRGRDQIIEMVSGLRVNSMSIDAQARKTINMQFGMAGSEYFFNPIEIKAADTKLDFIDDEDTLVATVKAGFYKDPHDMASAIETAMNALGSANVFTVKYNDTGAKAGKFTFTSDGTTFSLLLNTGANAANSIGDKIGLSAAADKTGALTYDSDSELSWAPPVNPSFDSNDPLVAKDNEVLIGDATDTDNFSVQSIRVNANTTQESKPDITKKSGNDGKVATAREISIDISAAIKKHDVDKYRRYRKGDKTSFCFNFGVKSGDNWMPGKCGNIYVPDATISKFKIDDSNSIAVISATFTAFADNDGNGEFYMNFL